MRHRCTTAAAAAFQHAEKLQRIDAEDQACDHGDHHAAQAEANAAATAERAAAAVAGAVLDVVALPEVAPAHAVSPSRAHDRRAADYRSVPCRGVVAALRS